MKISAKEEINTSGLGNPAVPGGYNTPGFGLGNAAPAGPGPDQKLISDTAAVTPNGVDPLNTGFSIGGANDPLAEFEDNPAGMNIGGGNPTPPINSPSHPPIKNMAEDGMAMYNGEPAGIGEGGLPFGETDPFYEDDPDAQTFEDVDALPTFEDIGDSPDIAALPVDANGVIEPIIAPDEVIVEPELGVIPDVVLPLEEPVLEIGEEDVDVQIPENAFENDGKLEAIPVQESFYLPENQKIIVSKGDQIFILGHVREEFTPKFAESVFTRALKSLSESKGRGRAVVIGEKREKVAIVGRSMLVEIAKDWRLPGTKIIFEAHDLLQIVSAKPIQEKEETEDDKKENDKKKEDDKAKEEAEKEKLKKEEMYAYRRWKEAEAKRKEKEDKDEDDADSEEKKAEKDKAKKEAAFLQRQRTGGYI